MRSSFAILFLLFSFIELNGNNIQFEFREEEYQNHRVALEGPIHEAFVTQEFGNTVLEGVEEVPPKRITEEQPPRIDPKTIWIPGYWDWSYELNKYFWVSGIWRRPPPGHQWVQGRWKQYPKGWVRIRGFWSQIDESQLTFISETPPDPLNEMVNSPFPSNENFFWVPGYWEWDSKEKGFRWLSGKWEFFNAKWIYVPAHYRWQEEGFVLIPGYWDYLLEERGVAYSAVEVPPENLESIVYVPERKMNPFRVMENLFPFWPNYPVLFQHHFYYHYNTWIAWGATPPWWKWANWWTFPSQDAWWLWWWWTHSRYPNPPWINDTLASFLQPAPDFVIQLMQEIHPPPNIAFNGVMGSYQLIEGIKKVTGGRYPIVFSIEQMQRVQKFAYRRKIKPPYLRLSGRKSFEKAPNKPETDSTHAEKKMAPGRVKLPPLPQEEQSKTLSLDWLPAAGSINVPENQGEKHKIQVIRSLFLEASLHSLLAQQSYPPQSYVPPPPDEPPFQGHVPNYTHPQPPMQTQHLDRLMTEPQPQENPAGPRAHPFPDDESTLPYY